MPALPANVARAVKRLGADIALARRRQRIPMDLLCERADLGRNTLARIERGDPGVSLGRYASVLHVLGMTARLASLAATDTVGESLEPDNLPERVRLPRDRAPRPLP